MLFLFFKFTMMLLLIKFLVGQKIGLDFGKMFGTRYMRYMVEKLLDTLVAQCNKEYRYQFYDEDQLANKVVKIQPYPNIYIKLKMNRDQYYEIVCAINKEEFPKNGQYMAEGDVRKWILNCVVGKISKE